MTFDYVSKAATAKRLLVKFGRDCTLRKVVTGTYDPATGGVPTTVTESTVTAADFSVSGETDVDGTLIKATDRYALISGTDDTDITTDDKLVIDVTEYKIIVVKKLSPAGIMVLFKVYIRK